MRGEEGGETAVEESYTRREEGKIGAWICTY